MIWEMIAREYESVLASAARTADPSAVLVEVPPRAESVLLLIDVTAIALTPSITVSVEGLVPHSGTAYSILDSAAITAVGVTALEIGLGLDDTANEVESALLPQVLQVSVAHADADSITYGIDALFS